MKRIHIVGSSGSGKSTLSRSLSEVLGIPHIELDAIHHLPNWTPIPRKEFEEVVDRKTDAPTWIVDGNYRRLRPIIWRKATHLIWLDLPFPLVMYRCVRRTTKRVLTREELFNGNRETFRNAFLSGDSVIWYTLHNHHRRRRQYLAAFESDEQAGMTRIRLTSPAEIQHFLEQQSLS
ncbi:MAG: adenylate kinase [Rhodothermales bacterium]|nr:adenylate kinase [Rhodothermales bacterium]